MFHAEIQKGYKMLEKISVLPYFKTASGDFSGTVLSELLP